MVGEAESYAAGSKIVTVPTYDQVSTPREAEGRKVPERFCCVPCCLIRSEMSVDQTPNTEKD